MACGSEAKANLITIDNVTRVCKKIESMSNEKKAGVIHSRGGAANRGENTSSKAGN